MTAAENRHTKRTSLKPQLIWEESSRAAKGSASLFTAARSESLSMPQHCRLAEHSYSPVASRSYLWQPHETRSKSMVKLSTPLRHCAQRRMGYPYDSEWFALKRRRLQRMQPPLKLPALVGVHATQQRPAPVQRKAVARRSRTPLPVRPPESPRKNLLCPWAAQTSSSSR